MAISYRDLRVWRSAGVAILREASIDHLHGHAILSKIGGLRLIKPDAESGGFNSQQYCGRQRPFDRS